MTSTRSRTFRLIAAVAAVSALSGCSSKAEDARPTESPQRESLTESPSESATGEAAPTAALLVAEPDLGRVTCIERVTASQQLAMYDPIARADGDVTITAIRAVGTKVRLVHAEGVVVTSDPSYGPGALTDDTWPITSERLRRKTDLSTRQELRGMTLTDGQRVLPLFAVRGGPGSTLDGLRLTYVDAGDHVQRLTLPIGTRFARDDCPVA